MPENWASNDGGIVAVLSKQVEAFVSVQRENDGQTDIKWVSKKPWRGIIVHSAWHESRSAREDAVLWGVTPCILVHEQHWPTCSIQQPRVIQLVLQIPCRAWEQKIHYRVHKSQPQDPVLSQLNRVHTLTSCLFIIHFNIILLSILSASKLYVTKILGVFLVYPTHAICPAHFNVLNHVWQTADATRYDARLRQF